LVLKKFTKVGHLGKQIFVRNSKHQYYVYLSSAIRKQIEGYKYIEVWYDPDDRVIVFKLLKNPTKDSFILSHREGGGLLIGVRKLINFLRIKEDHYPVEVDLKQGIISFTYEIDHDDSNQN